MELTGAVLLISFSQYFRYCAIANVQCNVLMGRGHGLQNYLSPTGVCYLLLVKENKPAEIGRILRERYHLTSEVCIMWGCVDATYHKGDVCADRDGEEGEK